MKSTSRLTRRATGRWFLVLGIVMVELCMVLHQCNATTDESSVYRESVGQQDPPCAKRLYPTYSFERDEKAHRLVVDVPRISPEDLNVEVDYEKGLIEVLGWIEPSPSTDPSEINTCIYQEWTLQGDVQNPSIDIHDLVMELKNGILTVSIPIPESKLEPPPATEHVMADEQEAKKASPLRVTGGSKKLRGLARISETGNITSPAREEQLSDLKEDGTPVQKSNLEKDLERFIAVSLANTDEEYYWLHKM